jgi:hypothetical protein
LNEVPFLRREFSIESLQSAESAISEFRKGGGPSGWLARVGG